MAEKDKLVEETLEQKDPYKAKGEDFKVKLSGKKGDAVAKDKVIESDLLGSPRDSESASKGGPSEWGKGGKSFPVATNDEGSTALDEPCGVDLEGGSITCKGHTKTKAGEVADPKVSIK